MINQDSPFFYFETGRTTSCDHRSYYFVHPVDSIQLGPKDDLEQFFHELEQLSRKYYLAGFFSYELGYALEEVFPLPASTGFPLAYFGIYDKPVIRDPEKDGFIQNALDHETACGDYAVRNLRFNTGKEEYLDRIKVIKEQIFQGDIYQLNFTLKCKFDLEGSVQGLYRDLMQRQPVPYHVFGMFDDYHIISCSPELFFFRDRDRILVKPMKGTWKRGRTLQEDFRNQKALRDDEKNQSENVMIVDLMRNDLNKVSLADTVRVTRLFEVEKYNTLFQMTSSVRSRLNKDTTMFRLMQGLFPSGSVTGAPKIRSMELIRELEKEERKVYTGALGFITPDNRAVFNVGIRTLLVRGNEGEMGIGSGIVYDSDPEAEFDETMLKSCFMTQRQMPDFQILETILWDRTYCHLDLHLKRLRDSAEYFGFGLDENRIRSELERAAQSFSREARKVRLLVDKKNDIILEPVKLTGPLHPLILALSEKRVDSSDPFLYHKTTKRGFLDEELARAREQNFFDILFLNENDEITQGAVTNVYVQKDNIIHTPPVSSGLLNGVMRCVMKKKKKIVEKKLFIQDLVHADAIYVSNALIGFQQAWFFPEKYRKDVLSVIS